MRSVTPHRWVKSSLAGAGDDTGGTLRISLPALRWIRLLDACVRGIMRIMKAIETRYNGYRFRSRLEARWAVFFDVMGWKYLYEPEGFDLNGIWYLPDFYLPADDTWFEVKPSENLTREEEEKITRFLEANPQYMLLVGDPSDDMAVLIHGGDHVHEVLIFDCPCCGNLAICDKVVPQEVRQAIMIKSRFKEAVLAAHSARFEHGDTPKIPKVLRPPQQKWVVSSLGLSDADGGGRDYWIESESMPGEIIYFCGNDN
jgi:hypothetical protein